MLWPSQSKSKMYLFWLWPISASPGRQSLQAGSAPPYELLEGDNAEALFSWSLPTNTGPCETVGGFAMA